MKIGIMTYHYFNNYGTVLQAFALQRALSRLGYSSEIIDFRASDPAVASALSGVSFNRVPLFNIPEYKKAFELFKNQLVQRSEGFERFRGSFLKTSRKYDYESIRENPPEYDVYLSGSDQIWNTVDRNYKQNAPYMLEFTSNSNKIAYASGMYKTAFPFYSSTYHHFTWKIEQRYIDLLKQYKVITVRENEAFWSLSKYLSNVEGVVLDPTLLLRPEEYEGCMSCPECTDIYGEQVDFQVPYILVYTLALREPGLEDTLKAFARERGVKIYIIGSDIPIEKSEEIQTLLTVSPGQWLWIIKHADSILTDSFHGLVFSLLFKKQFAAVTVDFRKLSLLMLLKVGGHRIFSSFAEIPIGLPEPVDYASLAKTLELERSRCLSLLWGAVERCNI